MENNNTKSPPVRLVDLATELGIPVEALEIDARDIFQDAPGFRVCTSFTASRVLELHRAREAKAKARAERNNAQVRAAAERARAGIGPGVEALTLGWATVERSPIPAAAAMLAKGPAPEYDGSTMTKRPSRLDWMTGKNLEGGTIGPSERKVREDALEKKRGKVHRLGQRGGAK